MHMDALFRLVESKAKAAGITDEFDVQEAKDIFICIFDWSGRDNWLHAPQDELKYGADRVLTNEVAQAAQRYMQLDWLRDEVLDWLLADAMAFGEINSTHKLLSPLRFYYKNGEPIIWRMFLRPLIGLFLWAALLLVVFFLYQSSKILAGAVLAWVIAYQVRKHLRTRRVLQLLASMEDVYGALDSFPPSWRNLYAQMEQSRERGAKLPTPLYRLVERNLEG